LLGREPVLVLEAGVVGVLHDPGAHRRAGPALERFGHQYRRMQASLRRISSPASTRTRRSVGFSVLSASSASVRWSVSSVVSVIGKKNRAASPSTQPSRTAVVPGSSSKYRTA